MRRKKKCLISLIVICCVVLLPLAAWHLYDSYLYSQLIQSTPVKINGKFLGNGRVTSPSLYSLNRNRREALKRKYNYHAVGILKIPSVRIVLPIFSGANTYTLSLGVAKDFYLDAEMGKGNYVLAGHNMELPGVLLSDLKSVAINDTVYLYDRQTKYTYKVYRNNVATPYVKLVDNKPVPGSAYALPNKKQPAIVTIYNCAGNGEKRRIVQAKLISRERVKSKEERVKSEF